MIGRGEGSEPGQFKYPNQLTLLSAVPGSSRNPQLFVTDTNKHRVQVFDAISGDHVCVIGNGQGNGLGQMSLPCGVSICRGKDGRIIIYVSETGNNQIGRAHV